MPHAASRADGAAVKAVMTAPALRASACACAERFVLTAKTEVTDQMLTFGACCLPLILA